MPIAVTIERVPAGSLGCTKTDQELKKGRKTTIDDRRAASKERRNARENVPRWQGTSVKVPVIQKERARVRETVHGLVGGRGREDERVRSPIFPAFRAARVTAAPDLK